MAISQSGSFLNRRFAELMLVLFIFCSAVIGGVFTSRTVFDSVPHLEDEVTYLFQAKVFAEGMVYAPAAEDPAFFEIPFVLNYQGKWFGKYPPGYPLVLAVGVILGAPWMVNPVMGGLSAVLIYLLGKSLFSQRVGVVGAILCLSSPMFLLQNGSFMSHPATLFFELCFVLCILKVYRGGPWLYAILAGVFLGIAFISRPFTMLAVGLPFLVLGLVDFWRKGFPAFKRYAVVALVFGLFASLLPAFNYVLTGNPLQNTYELWWPFDRIGFGDQYGLAGHSVMQGLENTRENLSALTVDLYGWPLYLSLVFIPLALLFGRNLWDWFLLAIFASVVAFYIAYWASGVMYGPRYYFETLPALVLLTARGLVIVVDVLNSWGRQLYPASRQRVGIPIVVLVVGGLTAGNLASYLPNQMAFYHDWDGISGTNLRIVQSANLHQAVVFVSLDNGWSDFGSVVSALEPTLDSDIVFAIDRRGQNVLLMDRYLGRAYYRLSEGKVKRIVREEDWHASQ